MGNIGEQTNATFDYYVDATINNISTTTKTESITTTKNGVNTYYKAMVGITLQFKDSQTEEVIASPMFKISDVDVAWIETEESAITSTLRKLSAYVGGYCNRKYPIYGTIKVFSIIVILIKANNNKLMPNLPNRFFDKFLIKKTRL